MSSTLTCTPTPAVTDALVSSDALVSTGALSTGALRTTRAVVTAAASRTTGGVPVSREVSMWRDAVRGSAHTATDNSMTDPAHAIAAPAAAFADAYAAAKQAAPPRGNPR